MTTIAWDGKTLAVDSRATSGGIVTSDKQKKLFLNVGRYKAVAISGSVIALSAVIKWIKEGENGGPPKTDEYDCIKCVTKDGKLHTFWFSESMEPQLTDGVAAGGNGWEVAIGAMDAGASAVEAVKIVCKRNIYTGGKVQSYTYSD